MKIGIVFLVTLSVNLTINAQFVKTLNETFSVEMPCDAKLEKLWPEEDKGERYRCESKPFTYIITSYKFKWKKETSKTELDSIYEHKAERLKNDSIKNGVTIKDFYFENIKGMEVRYKSYRTTGTIFDLLIKGSTYVNVIRRHIVRENYDYEFEMSVPEKKEALMQGECDKFFSSIKFIEKHSEATKGSWKIFLILGPVILSILVIFIVWKFKRK